MSPPPITDADLELRFGYHKPASEAELRAHEAIRAACHEAAAIIVELTPACREQSLALTEIESAMMWANAAIARRISAPKNALREDGGDA